MRIKWIKGNRPKGWPCFDLDKDGNPTPRGEVLLRGGNVTPGYYKMEAKT